jgi:hypothetical protein
MAGPASISLTRSETKPTALHFIGEFFCSNDIFTAYRRLIKVHSRPSPQNSSKAAISKDPHTEFNYEAVGQEGNSRFQQTPACDYRILPLFFERHTVAFVCDLQLRRQNCQYSSQGELSILSTTYRPTKVRSMARMVARAFVDFDRDVLEKYDGTTSKPPSFARQIRRLRDT